MNLKLFTLFQAEKKWAWVLVFISSLVSGLAQTALLITINHAITIGKDDYNFSWLGLAFFLLVLLKFSTIYYSRVKSKSLVQSLQNSIRLRIIKRLIYAQLNFIDNKGNEKLYTNLTHDVDTIAGSTQLILTLTEASVFVLCTLFYIGWLTLYGLLATIIMIILGVYSYQTTENRAIESIKATRRVDIEFFKSMSEFIFGFKELSLNNQKKTDINNHLKTVASKQKSLRMVTETLYAKSFVASQIFTYILIGFLVFILPNLALSELTLSFQFLTAILFILGPIETLVTSIPKITEINISLGRLERLETELKNQITFDTSSHKLQQAIPFKKIELKNIEFNFKNEHSDDIFKLGPLDFKLKRGEVVFIAGGNGSGKTVLAKILCNLYQPDSGELFINNKIFNDVNPQAYKEMFTSIFTDFYLFRSIYGIKNLDTETINNTLKELGIQHKTEFCEETQSFTTTKLSTGQRKRLAYLLCSLEDKQIYLFDEFAAEQDPKFREFFYTVLIPKMKEQGKTVVLVTHDDRYFNVCDRFIKMDYGKIISDIKP